MTESELTAILFAAHAVKDRHLSRHQIVIWFEGSIEDQEDVEHLVDAIQSVLDQDNSGALEIMGIDVENTGGEFLIACNEGADIERVFAQIRPILETCSFFEECHAALLPDGGRSPDDTKLEIIRESESPERDDDPELPVPEGVVASKGLESKGCFGSLAILLVAGLALVLLLNYSLA